MDTRKLRFPLAGESVLVRQSTKVLQSMCLGNSAIESGSMVEQNFDEESNLDIRRYIDVLIRWSWVVVVVATLAGVVAYAYMQTRTPIYQASSLIQIQQTQGSALPTYSDFMLSRALASTY